MYDLPFTLTTAVRATRTYAGSALPWAPVVAEPVAAARPRTTRSRSTVACWLHRFADVVSPA